VDGSDHEPLPPIRIGQGSTRLTREEFDRRFREQFFDPGFREVEAELAKIIEVAWRAYDDRNKSPTTHPLVLSSPIPRMNWPWNGSKPGRG
jgi:hypothetical protein